MEPAAYTNVALYGGVAQASLGFGSGPSVGLALRIKRASLPVVFRLDVQGSRFSQTPSLTGGGVLNGKATLTHAGATAGLELPLIKTGMFRPYLAAAGGVFRFQGTGPSGSNGSIANGVFTSTTDGALSVGGGVRLGRRVFLEARYITVSDFNAIPIVFGFVF